MRLQAVRTRILGPSRHNRLHKAAALQQLAKMTLANRAGVFVGCREALGRATKLFPPLEVAECAPRTDLNTIRRYRTSDWLKSLSHTMMV